MRAVVLGLLALWIVALAGAQTPPPTTTSAPSPSGTPSASIFWMTGVPQASSSNGKIQPSSLPLVFPGGIVYNLQEIDATTKAVVGSNTCVYSIQSAKYACMASPAANSVFSVQPIVGGTYSMGMDSFSYSGVVYSFSTGPIGSSSAVVASYIDSSDGTDKVRQYSAVATNEAIVSLSPYTLGNTAGVALRWTDSAAGANQAVTVALKTLTQTGTLVTGWSTTRWSNKLNTVQPGDPTNTIFYEGFVFYLIEEGTNVTLYKFNATAPNGKSAEWSLLNPCGLGASYRSPGLRLVPYDWVFQTGEILSALVLHGALANGQTAICRISHRRGTTEWTTPTLTLPNIAMIETIDGGYGNIILSGRGATSQGKQASSFIYAVEGHAGTLVWQEERHLDEQASAPSLGGGMVYYQANRGFVGRAIADGKILVEKPFTCIMKAVVTPSRVFCVTSSNSLISYSFKTDQMMWSYPNVNTLYDPQWIMGTDQVAIVVKDGGIAAIGGGQPSSNTPSPAPGPESESHAGTIALAVILSLLAVAALTGGLVWYFVSVRKRRSAISEEEGQMAREVPAAPTPTGLYGSVNE